MGALATLRRKLRAGRPFANFRGLVFYAQRRVRSIEGRRRMARVVAGFLPRGEAGDQGASQIAAALKQDGFAVLNELLTPQMVNEMRAHFLRQLVYAPYLDNSPRVLMENAHGLDSHVLWHEDASVISCPHVLDIANDPSVLSVMEAIFGCKPTIGYMTAWWSVPTDDRIPRHAENFHRDVDDLNFIKLFVYLTDVAEENGPHEYIRGSHIDGRLSRIQRYSDNQILETFGTDRLVRFIGAAGSAFLENTYGLHRGQPVQAGRRLIFQVVYSLLPMVYGPVQPFPISAAAPASRAIDPYINRQYVRL